MIYAYDLEFLEDGKTIDLISIGIVAEDGREFYAVNSDMDQDRIRRSEWLMTNVVPHLPLSRPIDTKRAFGDNTPPHFTLSARDVRIRPRWVIANEVREFFASDDFVRLWADCGAYDHVTLMQLWGPMIRKPAALPYFTHDLQQAREQQPDVELPPDPENAHDALADARHLMACLRTLGIVRASQ